MVGAGPHVHSKQGYQTVLEKVHERFLKEFNGTMGDKLLIWKTINPGGIPALGIVDDIPDLYEDQTMKTWTEMGYEEWWRWDLFPKFDRMAKEYFGPKGVAVLDMEPLYYRQDDHPGVNVHHCAHGNGALRLIPRLLQRLLEELDETGNLNQTSM